MRQGIARSPRVRPVGLQGHTVLQVPDAKQGHEGDGEVCADASGSPMVDGSDFEVVFTHPEGVLDLPQATVLAQDGWVVC